MLVYVYKGVLYPKTNFKIVIAWRTWKITLLVHFFKWGLYRVTLLPMEIWKQICVRLYANEMEEVPKRKKGLGNHLEIVVVYKLTTRMPKATIYIICGEGYS